MTTTAVRLTAQQKAEIIERDAAGESITSIAGMYCVTRPAIRGVLRRHGIPPRPNGRLTDSQRTEAVGRYTAGETMAQVATAYGITEPSVRSLLTLRGVAIRSVHHTLSHDAFDSLTADACYWIGFLFADGSVTARPGRAPQISVGLAERDRQHLVDLRRFLGSSHSISSSGGTRRSCQFSVRSDRLAHQLLSLGRYAGAIGPDLAGSRHFWRGVVDGDGSIGAYPRTKTSGHLRTQFKLVGQRRLLDTFADFLVDAGTARLSVTPHKTIHIIGTTGKPAEKIIDLLYSGAPTALLRKSRIAEQVLSAVEGVPA